MITGKTIIEAYNFPIPKASLIPLVLCSRPHEAVYEARCLVLFPDAGKTVLGCCPVLAMPTEEILLKVLELSVKA